MKNNDSEKNLDLLSIGEASEYLGISIDTLRRWERKGRINPMRSPGGHRYFSKKDLEDLFGKRYTRDEETLRKKDTQDKEALQTLGETSTPLNPAITTNTTQPIIPVGIPSWRSIENTMVTEKSIVTEASSVQEKSDLIESASGNDYKVFSLNTNKEQVNLNPSAYKQDSRILDRPIREIKIPERRVISVTRVRETAINASGGATNIHTEQSYFKQQNVSILTPLNIGVDKKIDTNPVVKIDTVSNNTLHKETVSNTRNQNESYNIASKKTSIKTLVAIILVVIGLIFGSIAWYSLWQKSQIVLSPIP